MRKPCEALNRRLAKLPDPPRALRSPQERNLLQFSPFAGLEEGVPSSTGRFRRVMTTVSGSNGPGHLINLSSGQLSQMSSSDSGEGAGPSLMGSQNRGTLTIGGDMARREDSNGGVEEESAPHSHGNRGTKSESVNLEQTTVQRKPSSPARGRRRGSSEVVPDMEASEMKVESTENSSVLTTVGAEKEGNGSGNTVLRGVTAALTKKLSQGDGKMIRKISGLLSRSKPVSPMGSQRMPKLDSDDGTGGQDVKTERETGLRREVKAEREIAVRKGSVLGMLGPLGKRSFIRSPKRRAERKNKSEDFEVQTMDCEKGNGAPSERDTKLSTAAITAIGGKRADDGGCVTEDDLAKCAVQIETFLNSVAFL